MDVGALNKRVSLYRFTKVDDGYGGFKNEKTFVGKIWCKVVEQDGIIQSQEGRRGYFLTLELVIRKRTANNVKVDDVLTYQDVDYRINSKKEIVVDYWTQISCTKNG